MNGTYKPAPFIEFYIYERGKLRRIQAPSYEDRIVQKCLCDNYLTPLLRPLMIYDNSATLEQRGTHFALQRVQTHYEKFIRENNGEGYVVIFDFKNYFGSIDHANCLVKIGRYITDGRLFDMIKDYIYSFNPIDQVGLGLGSQVSQICAVFYPNSIDHWFKDHLGVKYYHRYMDDGIIFAKDKQTALFYIGNLLVQAKSIGLSIPNHKIHMIKIPGAFTYLKHTYKLYPNNHIVVKSCERSLRKTREKLRKFNHKFSLEYILNFYASIRGNLVKYNNYKAICNLDNIVYDLYIEPYIERSYEYEQRCA
jgi:hypothetical protein